MKVSIHHSEKTQGLVFKKTLHGVELFIQFSEEEKAIITERKLEGDIVVERGAPADIDAEKHANRGLTKRIATAMISGADANHFDLTIGKLLKGTDIFFFTTPAEAKEYEAILHEELPKLKAYIVENEGTGKGSSFEL